MFGLLLALAAPPMQTGSLLPGDHGASPIEVWQAPRSVQQAPNSQAVETSRAMASCIAKMDAGRAREYILATSVVPASLTRILDGEMSHCLIGFNGNAVELKISSADLKAFLAEALLRRTMPILAPTSIDGKIVKPAWLREDERHAAMDATSACVTRLHPDLAEGVMATDPDSVSEGKAIAAIMPALSACIDPEAGFRADRVAMRLSLSLAIYHRAYDN